MIVFAYGSLIWNPGFVFETASPALARNWQRKWCVHSVVHRGTIECPGKVLGLVPGGTCVGIAYKVPRGDEATVLAYLVEREMAEYGYRIVTIEVETEAGTDDAMCFVADGTCDDSDEDVMNSIRRAHGQSGSNLDYLKRSHECAGQITIPDYWPRPSIGLPQNIIEAIFS